ncbi:MAG: hypothetical protein ACKVQW_09995 [Pyrinomonadaceae bacterium]
MTRTIIIGRLKGLIPEKHWKGVWWFLPSFAIILLPFGSLFLQILAYMGFEDAPRLTQLLMAFSVLFGPAIGLSCLFFVDYAGFPPTHADRLKWLARIAVVFPLLLLLTLFLVFAK